MNLRPNGGYSAVWGYTAPNGREYALIGLNGSNGQPAGTSIVDITDISSMRQAAFISGPASSWREMKTYKQYAYIVSEASSGVQIVNLSQLPDTAWLVRTFNYTSGSRNILRNHTISIHDGFMYLNGSANWSPGGIVIFDLRQDPTNPQYAGQYQPAYIHDSYVLRDTIYGSAIYSGGGLYIADATNKSNIQTIGRIAYAGSGTHNAWVTKDRRFVITTDEIGSITPKQLQFWDISNIPPVPTVRTSAFTPSPADIVHNVTVRGDYAYVAWYTLGVVVVDITNPATPGYAGGFDTSTRPPGGYEGVWGIYPYFPSGKIVAGDMQNGLWVFSFSGLAPRRPLQLFEPVNNDTMIGRRSVTFRWSAVANQNEDPHHYLLRIVGGSMDTTIRRIDTSFTELSSLIGFQANTTYQWYVTAEDEFNSTGSVDTFRFVFNPAVAMIATTTDSIQFGLVTRDSSRTLPLGITNIGSATLIIDSIVTTHPSFTTDFVSTVFLPPDSGLVTQVTFTPRAVGTFDGILKIYSNAYLQREKHIMLSGIGDDPLGIGNRPATPSTYRLEQNYPNPFNPSTSITYSLARGGYVSLKVHNVLGEEVASLVQGPQMAGSYTVSFDGSKLSSGVFFYRLITPTFTDVKKMVLVK